MSPAKTAKPIEMPFGLLPLMDQWNHVLDGVPDSQWEGALLRARDPFGKLVAKALDLQLAGCEFNFRPQRCRITTLGKVVYTHVPQQVT